MPVSFAKMCYSTIDCDTVLKFLASIELARKLFRICKINDHIASLRFSIVINRSAMGSLFTIHRNIGMWYGKVYEIPPGYVSICDCMRILV